MMSSNDIRSLFLRYFADRGHQVVTSSSLVPKQDPTLLFTNAGMNQFKAVFTGEEQRGYVRAVSSQKCVRAGGKHNDLENVGHTARHHTFFEMLGNFSFGDYFKQQAIELAWTLVTENYRVPADRLYVSVYVDDDDAYHIWQQHIGLSSDRIVRLGAKDNFWAMGPVGPCGPCSEIFIDQGPGFYGQQVGDDGDRFVEFWNLVFMEFEQKSDGSRVRLPKPSIDTGMGLERISAILQGVSSNYDTDLFQPILNAIAKRAGLSGYQQASQPEQVSLRVIADHLRCMAFLIADGVYPSKEGRGYVLRRIMRRAMRHSRKLALPGVVLFELVQAVIDVMGQAFPELPQQHKQIADIIHTEEQRFSQTIDRGLALLEEAINQLQKNKQTVLSGAVAFHLYDTFGFPIDMTADILEDQWLSLDQDGFEAAFEAHREKARGSWKGSDQTSQAQWLADWMRQNISTEFVGYDSLQASGKILQLLINGQPVDSAVAGDDVELIADSTPFYGESGGQVGDIGSISASNVELSVVDTVKPAMNVILHRCIVTHGQVKVGQQAVFSVDDQARQMTARHHTATHLLHAALVEVLGDHVQQKGSLVAPERLRFDFTHSQALTRDQLTRIETLVNQQIWCHAPVHREIMPLDKAMQTGAKALFDEKYGEQVRVVTVDGFSKELCGGTHVERTGDIGFFKIIKESSISAGIRRVEALTSKAAQRYVSDLEQTVRNLTQLLGTQVEGLEGRINQLLEQHKKLKKEHERRGSSGPLHEVLRQEKNGIAYAHQICEDMDHKLLRDVADRLLQHIKQGVVAVGSHQNGKAYVVVKVSKELTKRVAAGDLIQHAAQCLNGSGGGRPDMAQAGGPQIDALPQALASVFDHLP